MMYRIESNLNVGNIVWPNAIMRRKLIFHYTSSKRDTTAWCSSSGGSCRAQIIINREHKTAPLTPTTESMTDCAFMQALCYRLSSVDNLLMFKHFKNTSRRNFLLNLFAGIHFRARIQIEFAHNAIEKRFFAYTVHHCVHCLPNLLPNNFRRSREARKRREKQRWVA